MQCFNPKDPLIQENLNHIYALLLDPRAIVYFIASPWLREILAKGEHPLIQGIVPWIKETLVNGKGLLIQKRIVWDLIKGVLDKKNEFIFSNGDMRITWDSEDSIPVLDTGISWEDKSLFSDIIKVTGDKK